jgi:hypothetical protein
MPADYNAAMGFNKRQMEIDRSLAAEKEAAVRRALDPQIREDALRLVETWNARQQARMPVLFAPTIGAAMAARYFFLHVRCPACRTTQSVDLRRVDRHRDAAITSLIPSLSCRSCRPNAPFAELLCLALQSVSDEINLPRNQMIVGE